MLSLKCDSFGALAANAYLITDTESGESTLIDCPSFTRRMRKFVADANLKFFYLPTVILII